MKTDRRQFLLTSATVGASLVAGCSVMSPEGQRSVAAPALSPQDKDITQAIAMNAWIRLSPDGVVWLAMPRSEMGQGAHQGLRMLVAEELGCAVDAVRLEDVDVATPYVNQTVLAETVPFRPDDNGLIAETARSVMRQTAKLLGVQVTGGSTTIMDAWTGVRGLAAGTRQRLELAAARQWKVDVATVSLREGILRGPDGQQLPMQAVLADAAALSAPSNIRYRDPAQYTVIGSNPPRTDLRNKVNGSAVFGVDVRLPGRLTGAPRFCPVMGGTVKNLRNRDALMARPGVEAVIIVPALATSGGIVVVANNWWTAQQAAAAADIEWSKPVDAPLMESARISAQLRRAVDADDTHWTYSKRGEANWSADKNTPPRLTSRYEVPYLAHATMEPMNATAWMRGQRLDVWAPTQAQGPARDKAAEVARLSTSAVRIHTTYLGGAFGRRLEADFIAVAVYVAAQLPGKPVQVMWSREEDTTHDFYRPPAVGRLQARIATDGRITHWHHRTASPSVAHQAFRRIGLPGIGPDKSVAEGAFDTAYTPPNLRVDHALFDPGVPIGYWRSVGHSYQAFFVESFMDELAVLAGMDPLNFRLKNLPANSRQARVLRAACEMADYVPVSGVQARSGGSPTTAMGMAVHFSFGSVVAMVLEVQRVAGSDSESAAGKRGSGGIRVTRAWCAAECGLVVHPDGVRQQIEGGIVFGLTAALKSRIDIAGGAVAQRNFSDYPLLSLAETPVMAVKILPSANPPAGAGEISVPPVAPALANALFRLTGQRQRELPLRV